MIKSIKAILAQDKEKFKVPRKVQDLIPIKNIWPDGIFKVGNKFSKSFRFSDINYLVASREDKESMFLTYSELLNSLDSGATTKITINNHRLNKSDFEESILMPMKQDGLDEYRKEYNDMLLDKATGANGITQEKYITITVAKKDIEEARAYFARIGADLTAHFANLGSKCVPLNAVERLRILHDFYRPGDEAASLNTRDLRIFDFHPNSKIQRRLRQMGFNYGLEKRKFTEEWKKLYREYKAAGMSEEDIQDIYAFDLNVFRKNRTECQRTQPLSESSCDDGTEQGESMSALLKKFSSALSVCDKYSFQSDPRFAWVDEMENDELYRKIISLPKRDMDLLTLIAFEGYSQREVAEIRGIAPAAICKKIAKLKKLLYGG